MKRCAELLLLFRRLPEDVIVMDVHIEPPRALCEGLPDLTEPVDPQLLAIEALPHEL